jgi:hypothetical protein
MEVIANDQTSRDLRLGVVLGVTNKTDHPKQDAHVVSVTNTIVDEMEL